MKFTGKVPNANMRVHIKFGNDQRFFDRKTGIGDASGDITCGAATSVEPQLESLWGEHRATREPVSKRVWWGCVNAHTP